MSRTFNPSRLKKPHLNTFLDSNEFLKCTLLKSFPGATSVHDALGILHRAYPEHFSREDRDELYKRILDCIEDKLEPGEREDVVSVFALTAASVRSNSVFYIPKNFYKRITDGNGIFYFDHGHIHVYSPLREYIANHWSVPQRETAVITEWLRYLTKSSKDRFDNIKLVEKPFFNDLVTEIIKARSTGSITETEYDAIVAATQAFQDIRLDGVHYSVIELIESVKEIFKPVLSAQWVECPACRYLINLH